jgi:hypothetical protein
VDLEQDGDGALAHIPAGCPVELVGSETDSAGLGVVLARPAARQPPPLNDLSKEVNRT